MRLPRFLRYRLHTPVWHASDDFEDSSSTADAMHLIACDPVVYYRAPWHQFLHQWRCLALTS